MLRDFSWLEPLPRNFFVPKRRLRAWRRWGRYYRTSEDFKLLKSIELERERLVLATENHGSTFWLLPYRTQFRQLFAELHSYRNKGDIDVIRYYMAFCPSEMIPICVWLIGRCGKRFWHYDLDSFSRDPSPIVRKHVAKALRRLEASPLLEEMASRYPEDKRIQFFANSGPVVQRPFADRLSRFIKSVDDSYAEEAVTPSRMSFWARDKTWDYTPPKSVLLIRRMLRRIQHWVRWGMN